MCTHIKSFSSRTKNDRGTYLGFSGHIFGAACFDNLGPHVLIISRPKWTAHFRINSTTPGECRQFDLKKYINMQKDAHNDIQQVHKSTSGGVYPTLDKGSKVQHLLNVIHSSIKLKAAKAAGILCNDFTFHTHY
jgi:hypothetical protein